MHVSPILSLFQYYANRNLVGEEEVEMRRASVINHMRMLQYRAQGMMDTDGSATTLCIFFGHPCTDYCRKPKRNIFGRRQQKKSTHQGLILASLGSLGVHAVEAGLGDPGDIELTTPITFFA